MAKVSIIVPVYNAEGYIRKCLKSLQNQSFSDIKIICIENGSSDNSWKEILGQKMDKRLVALRAPHQDVSYARNLGLFWALKSSPYVMFCDADDTYDQSMVETMVSKMEETGVDLTCCEISVSYLTDHTLKKSDDDYYTLKFEGHSTKINEIINNVDYSLCNKIFRSKIIKDYSINFPANLHYEDACFCWKYLAVSNSIYFIKKRLYHYLRHANSIMNKTFTKNNGSIDHLKITNDVYEFLKKYNLLAKFTNEFSQFFNDSAGFAWGYSDSDSRCEVESLDRGLRRKFFINS